MQCKEWRWWDKRRNREEEHGEISKSQFFFFYVPLAIVEHCFSQDPTMATIFKIGKV